MMKKSIICNTGLCLVVFNFSFAQVQLIPLQYNRTLFHHQQPAGVRNTVSLPFIDDVSYLSPDPDPNLWINNGALVNLTFPVNPISYGVVTLDGLNGNGVPYDPLTFSFSSIGAADSLTSMPILLGSPHSPQDSVYLSFFFQPGGLGDWPNDATYNQLNFSVNFGDSIVLEFKDNTGSWN